MITSEVLTAIETYVAHLNTLKADYCQFSAQVGSKNTKIVMTYVNRRGASVHSFVENETGVLLKAAGWKAPAKGARGNLLTGMDDVIARADWSGRYLYR